MIASWLRRGEISRVISIIISWNFDLRLTRYKKLFHMVGLDSGFSMVKFIHPYRYGCQDCEIILCILTRVSFTYFRLFCLLFSTAREFGSFSEKKFVNNWLKIW